MKLQLPEAQAAALATIPGSPKSQADKSSEASGALAEQRKAFDNLKASLKEAKALKEPKAKPAEEPVAAEPAPEATPDADPKPEPKKAARSPEIERLKAKLQLAGAPKTAIEQLSDDDIRGWWTGIEERERTTALLLQRASEVEKKSKETTAQPTEPMRVPTVEADLIKDLHSKLTDQFGEDESDVLLEALNTLIEPLRKENAEIKKVLNDARSRGVQDISKANRKRLQEKLPSLKENDKAWGVIEAQVLQTFEKEPSKYSSAEEAFDDVFSTLYGDVISSKAPEPVKEYAEEKARVAASSMTPPSPQKHAKKATPMDAAFEAWKRLKKDPGDLEGAQRAYASALTPQ